MSSRGVAFILVATCVGLFPPVPVEVEAFLSPTQVAHTCVISSSHEASTALCMGKRKKPSMKERRKQRAKKQPGFKIDRGVLNDLPPVDSWEKTQPTPGTKRIAAGEAASTETSGSDADESEETVAKASSLVQSQRKSVDSLTFIRKRVEDSFPISDAAKALVEKGYFVHDNFLSSNEDEEYGSVLLSEMLQEGSDMLLNDKLERDIALLGDGEYVGKIVGGEKYADCPRLTEYVVSLTRHLPPIFNKELDLLSPENMSRLDSTASMGLIRQYDRKTRLGAQTLLMNPGTEDGTNDRPFGVICGDNEETENDSRRLTAIFFLSSKDWNASSCGGGFTIENGERLDAIRDRIVLFRSDTCYHRLEPWIGGDEVGLDQASCVIVHFVKETTSTGSQ